MAKVGVVGIPRFATQAATGWLPGATDIPRMDLELMLKEHSSGLEVHDLGELFIANNSPISRISLDGFSHDGTDVTVAYRSLARKAKNIIRRSYSDIVLAIGGDHSGVLPLYALPGHVVRADAHGDAYGPDYGEKGSLLWYLSGARYMKLVGKMGLKNAAEVWNVGLIDVFGRVEENDLTLAEQRYNGCFGKVAGVAQLLGWENPPEIGLFDIDVDVLSSTYGLPHPFSHSELTVGDLTALITKLKPRVVSLFECIQRDGSMPPGIVSSYPGIFGPICRAVAEVAIYRNNERLAAKA